MIRRRFLGIALGMAPALTGAAESRRWRGTALGGEVSITARGSFPERLERDIRGIVHLLDEIENAFSLYRPQSALSRLNAAGALDNPPFMLVDLLRYSKQVYRLTGGLFNPAIQPAWQHLASGGTPETIAYTGEFGNIGLSGERVEFPRPGMAITLNGIAQGYAADRIAVALHRLGYDDCLVNMGEFVAMDGEWRIAVRNASDRLLSTLTLSRRALATSSADALMFGSISHILNPHDGMAHRWKTVSVESDSATLADGLSTALIHMPEDRIRSLDVAATPIRVILESTAGEVRKIDLN
jgi:thiamine biosynthesis lipoprotein